MALDRRSVVVVLLFALAVVLASGVPAIGGDTHPNPEAEYVQVTNETYLWPYTSHSTSFESRTLAINFIVHGDQAMVEQHLRERGRGDWNETREETGDVDPVEAEQNGTLTAWASADGATRYVYVRYPDSDSGVWLTESYQLHDGDYYGTRHHIRAYESPTPDERWVAMQAHSEHWDWFRLRHTVDGVDRSQVYVEKEFMDRWFVAELSRTYLGNDQSPDTDGWVTIVEFVTRDASVAALLVVGVPVLRRLNRRVGSRTDAVSPRMMRAGLLVSALSGLYLAVRFGAIGAERIVPLSDPRYIAVPLYPVILVGLPAVAHLFARGLDQLAAFVAASVGFTTGILLDYTYLQVTVLPLDTLVHRLTLAIALGLIAAGAADPDGREEFGHRYFRTGVLLWLVALGLPLLRFV